MKSFFDTIVIGGGLVGSAIAFGLQRLGTNTLVIDEGDNALRAARGNFGLVWVQGKGADFSPYAHWTWSSAEAWQTLSDEIIELTGSKLGYSRPGGLELCFDEKDLKARKDKLLRLQAHQPNFTFEILGRNSVCDLMPDVGDKVIGAIYSPADGHVNPLYLLRGLHAAFQVKGGATKNGETVINIKKDGARYKIETKTSSYFGEQVILAAGLGNKKLGASIGLDIRVKPLRGQIIVTERLTKFFPYAATQIRQSEEGSVMIGVSHEEVGIDDGTTADVMKKMSKWGTNAFPKLTKAQVIRIWGALRVMTPDGYPIYDESKQYPGIFGVACHSGVTLAAAHSYHLAAALFKNKLPRILSPMAIKRFNNAPH